MIIKQILNKYFKYLILVSLIYMPIFGHLEKLPLRLYDESRQAINAYEMLTNGNYIVTHYDGKPDNWNSKPPLLVWTQVFLMKTIGVGILAVRLPSAIAALLTCLALLIFSIRYLKSYWFGFILVIVLITINGYISIHGSRTGDYDAMLTLFTTVSGLFFYIFIENNKTKYLYYFFLSITLAVLTKGIAGLLFIPALFIYSTLQKKLIIILTNKHFYLGLISFLILTVGYYFTRNFLSPGHIDAIIDNELGGRFLNTIEKHKQSFWFYYQNIIDFRLSEWYLLVPVGLILGLISKNKKIFRLTLFSTLMISTYFIIISSSQTKLSWYDIPMYPFLSIFVTISLFYIFNLIKNIQWLNQKLRYNFVPYIFLIIVFFTPYQNIVNKTYFPKEKTTEQHFYEIEYYFDDIIKGKQNLCSNNLLYSGYNAHIKFYENILNDKGIPISLIGWDDIEIGKDILICQRNVKDYIEQNYFYKKVRIKENLIYYTIYEKK